MPEVLSSALSEDWVQVAVRRKTRRSVTACILGLILFGLFVYIASYYGSQSDRLRSSGGRVLGVISVLHPDTGSSEGSAGVAYSVDGHGYREHVDLGSDADGYHAGQTVTVYYDQHNPARMTINNEDNQPAWTVWPMLIAFVAGGWLLIYGSFVLVRTRRNRRVLARSPWRTENCREIHVPGKGRFLQLDGSATIIHTGWVSRSDPAIVGLTKPVRICGETHRVVIADGDPPTRMHAARLPRSTDQQERWARDVHMDPTISTAADRGRATGASGPLTWRLPVTLMVGGYVIAAMFCVIGLVFGVGPGLRLSFITSWVDQSGSDVASILWGLGLIAAGGLTAVLMRRVALAMSDDELFVQNMLRSHHIPISDIQRVSYTDYGVLLTYNRDGHTHSLTATAGIGLKSAWTAETSRTKTIAEVITDRLPTPSTARTSTHR